MPSANAEPIEAKIKFSKRTVGNRDFFLVVKQRVQEYFHRQGISSRGNAELYGKFLLILGLYMLTYGGIVSDCFEGKTVVFLYCCLGVIKSLMGFNVTHDALHGAFSSFPFVNRILGHTFDFNGTSSYVWVVSHNGKHHTYTNIPGIDQDIDKAIILRFSPKDKLYWFHYYQNWYAPVLYCFTTLFWVLFSDYKWFWTESRKENVSAKDKVIFWGFKALNLFLFVIYPLLFLSISWVYIIGGYLGLQICGGLTVSIVFQLAHLVEGLHFPEPDENGNMTNQWAVHEMMTTSNFATKNRGLTFFLGGLNFQIEHHLFPQVSHVHYPKIAKIVKNTAREFQIPYNEIPTFWEAIKSHFRVLKQLGRHESISFEGKLSSEIL